MAYVADEIPITIRHKWYFQREDISPTRDIVYNIHMISSSFFSNALPDVRFEIFSAISGPRTFAVIVLKTPCDPANATIKILMNKTEMKVVNTNNWTNNCSIDDIPISKHYTPELDNTPFECQIIWHGYIKKIPTINLYHNMRHFHNTHDFTDFMIIINEEEIPVHKVILAAQSPVFSAMLKTDMKESADNRIIVKDIDIDIMRKVIEFLYTGEIDIESDVDTVFSILSVANLYQIMDLKNVCAEVLSAKMTVNNVLHILKEASLYAAPKLEEKATNFMINNKHEIIKLEDIEDFGCKNPKLLVKYMSRIIELSG